MKRIFLHVLFIIFIISQFSTAQELKTIPLPEPQTEIGIPIMKALKLRHSTRSFNTIPLKLQDLSNILWAADGINRHESGKRTSPSARNWQEP